MMMIATSCQTKIKPGELHRLNPGAEALISQKLYVFKLFHLATSILCDVSTKELKGEMDTKSSSIHKVMGLG